MKKKLFVLLMCCGIAFGLYLVAGSASADKVQASPQSVYVNGEAMDFEVYNINGYNYFKLRDLAFALSDSDTPFGVSYSQETESIALTTGAAYVPVGGEMNAGADNSASAVKSNQSLTIDGKAADLSPWNIGGSNFFRLRDLGSALGFSVSYDDKLDRVIIGSAPQSGEVTLHFLDVGQGDAILIDDGEYEVLIDAGESAVGGEVVRYLENWVDGSLDLVIATHPHSDHIGGLPQVFRAYGVASLVDSGAQADTRTYREYAAQAGLLGANWQGDRDMTFTLPSGATLTILELLDNSKNMNDNSVAALFTYGSVDVLLTGDNEAEGEALLLPKVGDVDVFKAAHHGSRTANTLSLLEDIRPEYVIVSCGLGNSYGHPHAAAMDNFAAVNAVVYGTMTSGTIIMTTDGSTYTFNTNQPLSRTDAGDLAGATVTQPTPIPQPEPAPVDPGTAGGCVGNVNSKIVHLSGCSAVGQMSEKNKVWFTDLDSAYAAGYTPCQRCL